MQILLVIQGQPRNGRFQNILDYYSFVVGHLAQHVTKIKGYRSCKMHFQGCIIFILHYIVFVKIGKAAVHQLIAVGFFQVLENEF